MKKVLLLSLTLMLAQIAMAQQPISISSGDMPNVNDTFRFSVCDNLAGIVDINAVGSNQVWDYFALGSYNQRVDTLVDPVFGTPLIYNVTFSNIFDLDHFATLAAPNMLGQFGQGFVSINEVYDFYRETGSYFASVGLGMNINGFPLTSLMEPRDMIWEFPLEFGDVDNSFAQYGFEVPQFGHFGQKIWRENTVDGWGELTTRYGTFNTIRVTTIIETTDTISFNGFAFEQQRATEFEIKWLAKNVGAPILNVKGQVIFGEHLISSIEYLDSIRGFTLPGEGVVEPEDTTSTGISNGFELEQIAIGPNPISGSLNIDMVLQNSRTIRAELYNISGQMVLNLGTRYFAAGKHTWNYNFDSATLNAGMYNLMLTDELGFRLVRKMIKLD